jgi:hypothetical protein
LLDRYVKSIGVNPWRIGARVRGLAPAKAVDLAGMRTATDAARWRGGWNLDHYDWG